MALFHYVVKCEQPEAMDYLDFWRLWKSEAEGALAAMEAGKIVASWKVASRNIVIGVIDAESHEELDKIFNSLAMYKKMPRNMNMEILPVIPYETWPEHLSEIVNSLENEKRS
ncbi:muconolactone Delta-isomerase family protein [Priestia megaterium]